MYSSLVRPTDCIIISPVTVVTPFLAMQAAATLPTRHSNVTSTYRSVDHQAVSGDAAQAVSVADGSISSRVQTDNSLPPADLWRRAVNRGHGGAMLWPLPAKR